MSEERLQPPAELDMPIGEAMFTQRAIRRLRHDMPVSDAQLKLILDAAAKAPNGGNTQPLRWLVIRSPEKIAAFGKLYHQAWWAKRRDAYGWSGWEDIPEGSPYRHAALLADEIGKAPVILLALSEPTIPSSALPAVQNALLAARALGIGSVLTTLHAEVMSEVYALLGVPENIEFHACLPLGYPRGRFGTTARRPSAETTSWDEWGKPPPWA